MGAHPIEHGAKISEGIEVPRLARGAQAHQHRRRLAAVVAAGEQPVLAVMLSSALTEELDILGE
jgi:hypothetical protein